jgi:quercetin dioxygenase-like cupin family protein
MRVSSLKPYAEIPEHIDDPDQIRALALIDGQQNFTLRINDEETEYPMVKGEVWYINTAWPHRVKNPDDTTRLALLMDFSETDLDQWIANKDHENY